MYFILKYHEEILKSCHFVNSLNVLSIRQNSFKNLLVKISFGTIFALFQHIHTVTVCMQNKHMYQPINIEKIPAVLLVGTCSLTHIHELADRSLRTNQGRRLYRPTNGWRSGE